VVGLGALQVAVAAALPVLEVAVAMQRVAVVVAAKHLGAQKTISLTTVASASLLTRITAAVSVVVALALATEVAVAMQRVAVVVAVRRLDARRITSLTTVASASLLTRITAAVSVVVVLEAVKQQVAQSSTHRTFVITAIPLTQIIAAKTAQKGYGHDTLARTGISCTMALPRMQPKPSSVAVFNNPVAACSVEGCIAHGTRKKPLHIR
jgi:hypothetical protein